MIDSDGFRANVGIVLINDRAQAFWGRRVGMSAWQFPQGGIQKHETPTMAMFRELEEEVGLGSQHVELIGCTAGWLRYRLPKKYIRRYQKPICIGQKQRWFVLRLVASETHINLSFGSEPEFDDWRWIDYWKPLSSIVFFKREVYEQALSELAPLVRETTATNLPPAPVGA
ncbi:MAG TPA: RNA pyrophosphohydrolase [Gammaproteobacteria bacterium]|nr:RNA pyrophosphohydrolase [Gammaproteobacteria bacterium]|tara:strand:- start:192 stop:704 length:513 start_codon:yes stop_codon:yes gene_type:complete